MNAYSTPSVPAPPLNVSLASNGSTTWKLNASVPITAVSTRTSRSAGVDHAYRRPSRSWPLRFGTGSTAKNSFSRISHERQDGGRIRHTVGEEAPRDAETGDHEAGDRRADHPGGHEHRAAQAHRVAHVLGPHHLDHERAAGRVVEGVHGAETEREHEDHPQLDDAERGDRPEEQSEHAGGGLRTDEQPALVDAVGHEAAPRADEQDGCELQRHGHAEGDAAARDLEHEPGLRDRLHPRAGRRDQLSDEVQAVVADAHRPEREARGAPQAGHDRSFSENALEDLGGPLERVALIGREGRELPLEVGGLAGAALREQAPALGGDLDTGDAPVAARRCAGGTRPRSSSRPTAAVIVGGRTRSMAASSPRVSGPSRSIVASAASWVGDAEASPCWRRRRASRVTTSAQAARQRRRGHGLGGGRCASSFDQLVSLANYSAEPRPSHGV